MTLAELWLLFGMIGIVVITLSSVLTSFLMMSMTRRIDRLTSGINGRLHQLLEAARVIGEQTGRSDEKREMLSEKIERDSQG